MLSFRFSKEAHFTQAAEEKELPGRGYTVLHVERADVGCEEAATAPSPLAILDHLSRDVAIFPVETPYRQDTFGERALLSNVGTDHGNGWLFLLFHSIPVESLVSRRRAREKFRAEDEPGNTTLAWGRRFLQPQAVKEMVR